MSEDHVVKILKIDFLTHNVKKFITEKPVNYSFKPGQATSVSINEGSLKNEKRPFTFTSKPGDVFLEFIIKKYSNGITEKIHDLKQGQELIIGEAFGYFDYKGEGYFIAGGTGITPFLSIFRNLEAEEVKKNNLFFSNKTHQDIICENELTKMLGENAIFLLTDESREGYLNKRIDVDLLKESIDNFEKYFYVCGPLGFVNDIKEGLIKLGAKEEKIIS